MGWCSNVVLHFQYLNCLKILRSQLTNTIMDEYILNLKISEKNITCIDHFAGILFLYSSNSNPVNIKIVMYVISTILNANFIYVQCLCSILLIFINAQKQIEHIFCSTSKKLTLDMIKIVKISINIKE